MCPCFAKKEEKDLNKSEQLQLLLERLEKLERVYGHPDKELGIKFETEILDQRGFIHKICSDRKDLSFLGIVGLMKYRVSFFGIYSLTENVDLTYNKVEYMKKQLNVITAQLISNQNLLLKYFKQQRQQNLDMINKKFSEIAENEDFLNLKDEYDQTCKDHDDLIEDIQKELADLKEELKKTKEKQEEVVLAPGDAANPVEDKSRIVKKINSISNQLGQNDLSFKVEQFLKRIHESINIQDKDQMQNDLNMIQKMMEAQDFDSLANSIHRIVLKINEKEAKGLQRELKNLMTNLQFLKQKWSSFEQELHSLRQLQQKIGWNLMDYEMGAQTSVVEQRRLQFQLRQQQEVWNKVQ